MARSRRESDFYDVTFRRCLSERLTHKNIFTVASRLATQTVKRKITPKKMQNLVFLIEPSKDADVTNLEIGHMYLNRFSIDEDPAFEVSGVYYLKKSSYKNVLKSRVRQKH